ncbi:response regulator transcription factor [Bifidobacterium biavatii]|uniref:LuxR family two component transcriptional regulator n=1 Tax=Bifidobacterium biavatii DSM 23969 TaxID=1437608 RepID=A0A086ZT23_9BIFI|nr:response regulator transcription factor [Bifidobacterium biavatii]KFI49673.1 LuxR family two component transcriptional regulator [Bifidobacterium biavatii DSM 23969]
MTWVAAAVSRALRLDRMEQHGRRKPVSIAIVDNDRMALMALSSLLTRDGCAVTWTAQLGASAIQRCIRAQDRPDVLLVDMALSDMTGVDVCRAVRRWAPALPMIGVTAYDPAVYYDAAVAAGAAAVLSKDDVSAIADAVRAACACRRPDAPVGLPADARQAGSPAAPVSSSPADVVRSDEPDGPVDPVSPAGPSGPPIRSGCMDASRAQPERSFALSAQQSAIMRMYADGRSTDDIAAALGISKGTIFSQVARVRGKLHARDRDEAVALCRRYLRM